jgi:hypothetical protein
LLTEKHSFYIYDCKNIVFTVNENKTDKKAVFTKYLIDSVNKIGYYLSDEEKQKFKISLSVQYSADKEHNLTKIINAKLIGFVY